MQATRTNYNATHAAKTYASKPCQFCNSAEENEILFGSFHFLEEIVVHYYCLLLSSNVAQNGKDDEGILGFLAHDIRKELARGKRLHCSYCRKTGATLGCCNPKCKTMFHLPCGIANGSLHQFFDQFMSFCKNHRPRQKVPPQIIAEARKRGACCGCCIEPIEPQPSINVIWAPCCKKSSFFHRRCVQQMALTAGYFFKCPLCNNQKLFSKTMTEQGIYVPDRDAAWELEPGAYRELYVRPSECVAAQCKCPKGRNFCAGENSNSRWMVKPCDSCGSKGVHIGCGLLNLRNPKWDCEECMGILSKPRDELQNGGQNEESNEEENEENNEEEEEEDEETIEVDDIAEPDVEGDTGNDSAKEKQGESDSSGTAEEATEGRRLSRRLRHRSAHTLELPQRGRPSTRPSSNASANSTAGVAVPSGSGDFLVEPLENTEESPESSAAENSEEQSEEDGDGEGDDDGDVTEQPLNSDEIVELSSDDEDEPPPTTTYIQQGNDSSKLADFLVTLDGSKLEVHKMHTPLVPGAEQLSVVGDVKIPHQGRQIQFPTNSGQSSETSSGNTFKQLRKVVDANGEYKGYLMQSGSTVTVIQAPNNTMYSMPMSAILPSRAANNTGNQTQEFTPQIASVLSLNNAEPIHQFLNVNSSSQVIKSGSKYIRIDNIGNLTSPVQQPNQSNNMAQTAEQMKNQNVNVAARLNSLPLNVKPVIDSVNVSMNSQSQPLSFARLNPNSGRTINGMRALNPFNPNFGQLSLQNAANFQNATNLQNPNVQQFSVRQSNPILSAQLQGGISMNNLISNTIERQLTSSSNTLPTYTQLLNRSGGGMTLIQNGVITQEPGVPFRIENAVGNSTAYSAARPIPLGSNLPTMQPPFQMRRQVLPNPGQSCLIDLTDDAPPTKKPCSEDPEIVVLD